eukprot:SAG22_NODE_1217_length_5138_cov_6.636039_6_plen_354_part_00
MLLEAAAKDGQWFSSGNSRRNSKTAAAAAVVPSPFELALLFGCGTCAALLSKYGLETWSALDDRQDEELVWEEVYARYGDDLATLFMAVDVDPADAKRFAASKKVGQGATSSVRGLARSNKLSLRDAAADAENAAAAATLDADDDEDPMTVEVAVRKAAAALVAEAGRRLSQRCQREIVETGFEGVGFENGTLRDGSVLVSRVQVRPALPCPALQQCRMCSCAVGHPIPSHSPARFDAAPVLLACLQRLNTIYLVGGGVSCLRDRSSSSGWTRCSASTARAARPPGRTLDRPRPVGPPRPRRARASSTAAWSAAVARPPTPRAASGPSLRSRRKSGRPSSSRPSTPSGPMRRR